jgi:hypothetical protein
VAEQVSHHPPVSAFAFFSPENNLVIAGELRPKSKFLGNSAATIMEGTNKIALLDRPEDGEYVISMPNMYVIRLVSSYVCTQRIRMFTFLFSGMREGFFLARLALLEFHVKLARLYLLMRTAYRWF